MPSRCIKNAEQFDTLGKLLSGLEYPYTVEWRKGVDRSLQANALMWKWAGEFAAQIGDRPADQIQLQWKLDIGVPILRSENDEFREFSELSLRKLTYEQRLEAMKFVPVTSIMTVPQMKSLMDQIQQQANENGIILTIPEVSQ